MAKLVIDAAMDAALAYVANNADLMHVCTTQPANYAGIAALELANVALTVGAGNGDYTIANGDTSGRKLTVGAQSAVDITATGDAGHIVLSNGTDTIYLITTCTTQTLTDGGTVDVPAFDLEIADPA